MTPDLINGSFELLGGVLIWMNVWRMYKDQELKGVHWGPTLFFTVWGFWNLYYYPHLDQWLSFLGGIVIVAANATWISMTLYFLRKPKRLAVTEKHNSTA